MFQAWCYLVASVEKDVAPSSCAMRRVAGRLLLVRDGSPEEAAHRRLGYRSASTMTAWPVSGRPMSRPSFPSHFTESGGWTRDPIESPRTPTRWRVSLAGKEPTTAAVRRHLDAPAGDAPAEPIVREPPNSASPRHPLTGWTGPPRDRCRDDPTLVCVTRKPSGEAARPRGNGWPLRGEHPFLPATRPGCPGRRDRHL